MRYGIAYLVTRSTLLPFAVVISPLIIVVCLSTRLFNRSTVCQLVVTLNL